MIFRGVEKGEWTLVSFGRRGARTRTVLHFGEDNKMLLLIIFFFNKGCRFGLLRENNNSIPVLRFQI